MIVPDNQASLLRFRIDVKEGLGRFAHPVLVEIIFGVWSPISLSEGGLCATTLALNNSKEYVAFGNYSGDESPTYQSDNQQQTIQTLFGGSAASYNAENPPSLLKQQRFTGLAGWFEAGAQDPVAVKAAHALQGLAAGAGIGTCLATPYLQDYDLVMGAFVIVWLRMEEGRAQIPTLWIRAAMGMILLLPLVAAPLGKFTGLALGPLFIIPVFALLMRLAA